jgi:arsenate reductase
MTEARVPARVVFACERNAGRSQMAAALFNRMADPGRARAVFAGTDAAASVHPEVVQAMLEVGVDLSTATPQRLTLAVAAGASHLVTMGCGDACPFIPGAIRGRLAAPRPQGPPARRGPNDSRRHRRARRALGSSTRAGR